MYIPSNSLLLTDQRNDAANDLACSAQRINAMRVTSATGRAQLFNTLINPNAVAADLGTGAALNTAILQQQTETSRATGLLGTTAGGGSGPSLQDIIRDAPEVVSLNRGGGCNKTGARIPVPLDPNPQPGMPQRAPNIVQTAQGPLSIPGAPSTAVNANVQQRLPDIGFIQGLPTVPQRTMGMQYYAIENSAGLTGYAPPWSDAWVMEVAQNQASSDTGVASWLSDNWWLLALSVGGVVLFSRRSKR